jgi:hypothetical protein
LSSWVCAWRDGRIGRGTSEVRHKPSLDKGNRVDIRRRGDSCYSVGGTRFCHAGSPRLSWFERILTQVSPEGSKLLRRAVRLVSGSAVPVLMVAMLIVGVETSGVAFGADRRQLAPPPPYSWVKPPKGAIQNGVPRGGSHSVSLGLIAQADDAEGSFPDLSKATLTTNDGQAGLVFLAGAEAAGSGQSSVLVTLTPLAGAQVGPAPRGDSFWSNAYTITADYEPSGAPANSLPAYVFLQVPTDPALNGIGPPPPGAQVARWNGSSWIPLTTSAGSVELFAKSASLGSFVVISSSSYPSSTSHARLAIILGIVGVAIVLLGGVGIWLRRRSRREKAVTSKHSWQPDQRVGGGK